MKKKRSSWHLHSYKTSDLKRLEYNKAYCKLATLNHTPSSYICRVYLCGKKSVDATGYCEEHVSPTRTGLAPFTSGSAPVVKLVDNRKRYE